MQVHIQGSDSRTSTLTHQIQLSIGIHYPRCSFLSQEVWVSDQIASTCFPQYWSLCLCLRQFNEGQEYRDKDISKSQSGIPVLDARICLMAETRTVGVPPMARSPTWGSQMHSWLVASPPLVTMAMRDLGCQASIAVPDLQSLPNSHFPFQSPLLSPVDLATLCNIYQLTVMQPLLEYHKGWAAHSPPGPNQSPPTLTCLQSLLSVALKSVSRFCLALCLFFHCSCSCHSFFISSPLVDCLHLIASASSFLLLFSSVPYPPSWPLALPLSMNIWASGPVTSCLLCSSHPPP